MKTNAKTEISTLQKSLNKVFASFNTLFQDPLEGAFKVKQFDHREPFLLIKNIFLSVESELTSLNHAESAGASYKVNTPDSIDYLNALMSRYGDESLAEIIKSGVLDLMTAGRLFVIEENIDIHEDVMLDYQLQHAEVLIKDGIRLLKDYFNIAGKSSSSGPKRILPGIEEFLKPGSFKSKSQKDKISLAEELRAKALEIDPFKTSRVFRFTNSEFFPSELVSIRAVTDFFGYHEMRDVFHSYFSAFSKKGENFPLLISSLPGLGKTHFTISYTLSFDDLTLILPEPGDLEKPLETIISQLARRKNRKFVIFFDDVDTRKIDWYNFRTLVGGSFVLPENISIVIASNYEFPANISSRGRGLTFPIFDEIECMEMVRDFLRHMGMKNPPDPLVAVISADYVEAFGQNAFEELSPRTLVRYLEQYNHDARKRKKMLDMSREELVPQPDSLIFYEANLKVTERLNTSIGASRLKRTFFDDDDEFLEMDLKKV
jgi:hypothetical protein